MWFVLYLACLTAKYWLGPAERLVQLKYGFRQVIAKEILTA